MVDRRAQRGQGGTGGGGETEAVVVVEQWQGSGMRDERGCYPSELRPRKRLSSLMERERAK